MIAEAVDTNMWQGIGISLGAILVGLGSYFAGRHQRAAVHAESSAVAFGWQSVERAMSRLDMELTHLKEENKQMREELADFRAREHKLIGVVTELRAIMRAHNIDVPRIDLGDL